VTFSDNIVVSRSFTGTEFLKRLIFVRSGYALFRGPSFNPRLGEAFRPCSNAWSPKSWKLSRRALETRPQIVTLYPRPEGRGFTATSGNETSPN